jgi:membrane protein implicated in regulation of membrane protease activity
MNRIASAVKATYDFFTGDAILFVATLLAFLVGVLLVRVAKAPNPLSAAVFVALLVGGLATTLGREVRGRPRRR